MRPHQFQTNQLLLEGEVCYDNLSSNLHKQLGGLMKSEESSPFLGLGMVYVSAIIFLAPNWLIEGNLSDLRPATIISYIAWLSFVWSLVWSGVAAAWVGVRVHRKGLRGFKNNIHRCVVNRQCTAGFFHSQRERMSWVLIQKYGDKGAFISYWAAIALVLVFWPAVVIVSSKTKKSLF